MVGWIRQRLSGRQILVLAFAIPVFISGTIGRLNIEKWAEKKGWDSLLIGMEGPVTDIFTAALRFLASDLAIGMAMGAIVIAFWANAVRFWTSWRNKWIGVPSAPSSKPLTPVTSDPFNPALYTYDPADEVPDRTAYYDLMDFAVIYVVPACDYQIELQREIIRRASMNDKLAELAIDGLQMEGRSQSSDFWKHYNNLIHGIDSSEPTIRFEALIGCIKGLERNAYRKFCDQADEIAVLGNLDYKRDKSAGPIWEQWRTRHNALVTEYETKIKTQVRFGKLFRPLRQSRWGNTIEPAGPF